jgi:hypothetical protein
LSQRLRRSTSRRAASAIATARGSSA